MLINRIKHNEIKGFMSFTSENWVRRLYFEHEKPLGLRVRDTSTPNTYKFNFSLCITHLY
jgi:hypothetical protein